MNFIITLLLKATICLVLSTLLYFSAKKASASLRHWIVSLSLVGLLVLPFSSTILPEWQVETEVAQLLPASGKPTSNLTAIPTGTSSARPSEEVSAKAAQAVRPTSNLELHMISTSSSSPDAKMSLLQIVVILWAVGSFVFLFRLVIGIRATYQLNQKAIPARGHASSPGVNIAYHPSIKSPMTWGVWKPRILLPEHAKTWSEETLEVVLLHEMTHIKRHDYLIHVLSWIAVSLYWFHPLVWWFKNLQSVEREKACDEQVLKAGLSKATYAEQLVQVAKYLSPTTSSQHYAMPMAQNSQIKSRIVSILGFEVERFFFSKWKQFRWAATYVFAILVLASFTPVEPVQIMEMVNKNHPLTQLLREEQAQLETTADDLEVQPSPNADLPTATKTIAATSPIVALPAITPLPAKKLEHTAPAPSFTPLPLNSWNFTADSPSHREPEGVYGKWVEGKSTFEVWAIGAYKSLPDFPYLEVQSPESMVIIRERRKNKVYLMQITKAPYDGGMVIDWRDGKINAWNGGYHTGDPIYLFFIDDEWKFFGKSKLRWLSEHLPEINNRLMFAPYEKDWAKIDASDKMIQQQKELKEMHFVPYDKLPANFFESMPYWKNMRDQENPPFDYASLPFYSPSPSATASRNGERKVGGTRKVNSSTGGNAINDGQKFGRIIRKIPGGAKATNFNFHLKYNQFETLHFQLHLYQVKDDAVVAKLHEQTISIAATGKDWIQVPLDDHNITLTKEVLVILELRQRDGKKGEGHILFSQTAGPYQNFHESSGKEWGFWESNFAFNLDITP